MQIRNDLCNWQSANKRDRKSEKGKQGMQQVEGKMTNNEISTMLEAKYWLYF